jgi:hypothetical protein
MPSELSIKSKSKSTTPSGVIVSRAVEKLGRSTPIHTAHKIKGGGDCQQRIATAAYYRAEHRGFNCGDEIQDWLEAEAEIDNTP